MNEGKPAKPDRTMQSELASSPPSVEGKLTKDIQTKIGVQLRHMYDEVVREGVPDRFAALLRRLDDAEGETRS